MKLKRLRNSVLLAVVMLVVLPAVAAAAVRVSVSPSSPGVKSKITASYRTPAAVPRGYKWHLFLYNAKQARSKTCAGVAGVYLKGPVPAGYLIKYTFRPSAFGHSRWCRGSWQAIAAFSKPGSTKLYAVGVKKYTIS